MPIKQEILDQIRNNEIDTLNLVGLSPDKWGVFDPALEEKDCRLTDDDMEILAGLLIENTSIRKLILNNNFIRDRGAARLAEVIEKNPRIKDISAHNCQIGTEGGIALANAFMVNKSVTDVHIGMNRMEEAAMLAMAEALKKNRTLTHFQMPGQKDPWGQREDPLRDYQCEVFFKAISASPNKNLCSVSHTTMEGRNLCDETKNVVLALRDKLVKDASLTLADIYDINERKPALLTLATKETPKKLDEYDALVNSAPHIDPATVSAPEELFTPDDREFRALDNPKIMEHFPAICRSLREKGSPLTLEHLETRTRDGQSYFELLLGHAPIDSFLAGLNESGIRLHGKFMLEGGAPSEAFQTLIDRRETFELFSECNWKGANPRELREVIRALPDELKPSNHHALLSRLRMATAGMER